jgi:hypothetical protein
MNSDFARLVQVVFSIGDEQYLDHLLTKERTQVSKVLDSVEESLGGKASY